MRWDVKFESESKGKGIVSERPGEIKNDENGGLPDSARIKKDGPQA